MAALLGIWVCSGCAGNGPSVVGGGSGTPGGAASFDDIQHTIFDLHCLAGGCHNGTSRAGNLVLDAGTSYANLINRPVTNAAALAMGLLQVVPGQPDQSFLLIKLTLTGAGPYGSPMPLVGALPSSDIEMVRSWILNGAPGSTGPTVTPTMTQPPPTSTPTATATVTVTVTTTATATPSVTPTQPTATGTVPATATVTPTVPSPTATPTDSPTPSPSPSPSPSVPPTPTFSTASTFADIQTSIFNGAGCTAVACHSAVSMMGGMVLEDPVSYANLVNARCFNQAAQAAGLLRVVPGRPDESFLMTKLTLTSFTTPFGLPMPLVGSLTPDQIDHIRAWILRGALQTDHP